jgi:hypothetical protein
METEMRLIDANAIYDAVERRYRVSSGIEHRCERDLLDLICSAETVDAVPMEDMQEFAGDVVYQFGYYGQYDGRLHICHGGLSTLKWAFGILGWDNPHPAPEFECEIDGCHEHATCGAPTSDGYKRMCGKHYAERRTNERKAD